MATRGAKGKSAADDSQFVSALARGLALLEAFRRDDPPLGNAELAERTGLARPTVSRLAFTLVERGYLRFDPARRGYTLGHRAIALGAVARSMANVRMLALPLMRELAAGSHFNIGLGVRGGDHMVYTDACEGDALVALRLFAGSRIPIATSAMGRAYLASLADAERAELMAELRPRHADEWPRLLAAVERATAEYRERGFCTSLGDWQRDIHGVATPIKAAPGEPTYVLNLGGPAYALSEREMIDELGPRLVELRRRVEALAHVGQPDEGPLGDQVAAE